MTSLTPDDVAQLIVWFETVELPPVPFRTAPWATIYEPKEWRQVMLRDLHHGPADPYWQTSLIELRWLAKRIGPPDVRAAAHVDELVERQGWPF